MFKKFLRVTTSIAVALLVSSNAYRNGIPNTLNRPQNIENYSFDFSAHQLPIAYDTFGAAVQLHHHYKLIPDVKDRMGAIVLNQVSFIFFIFSHSSFL